MKSNLLENVIDLLSPSWSASRAHQRYIKNTYEAADHTRLHKAKRETKSANNSVAQSGVSLREQARSLDENHDIIIGILDKLEERVIGSKGINVEPQPLNKDGSVNDVLADDIRKKWAEWSTCPEVTGRFTRPSLERMMLRTWFRDGEVFAQLVKGKVAGLQHGTAVPFSLEALEPEFVPMETDMGKRLVQGIYLNAWRRPLQYMVFYENPQDTLSMQSKYKLVEAKNMLHLAFTKRLHQVRGVSMLHGVIVRMSDLKEYEESERVAARIAAALTMYIKKGDGQIYDMDSDEDRSDREIGIAPGMVIDDLKPGEDVGMINSNRPNTNLEGFRNGQLRAVAAGTRSSYSSIARDYNGTYSAQRQELVESFEGYAVLQDHFIAAVSRPIYREWLKMAIASGEIKVPNLVDEQSVYNAVYSGPVMPWIDPAKEVKAWKERITGGLSTESEAIRAGGKNPAEVKQRREVEIKQNKEKGLKFDTDLNSMERKNGKNKSTN